MKQRQAFLDKSIKDISSEDSFVSVSGVVVSKSDGSFVMDDGTGEIIVMLEADNLPSYVRVFGRLLNYDDGFRLQADFFQDLSKIDKLLYKKVKSLLNKN